MLQFLAVSPLVAAAGISTPLPEVVQGTAGRIPVICDGEFRRGTDIFKAMALAASSIGIGRPYILDLGAFGQEGVETVLALLCKVLPRADHRMTVKRVWTCFRATGIFCE